MTEFPSASFFCSESRSDAIILSMENFDDGLTNGWTGVSIPVDQCFGDNCIILVLGNKPTKTVMLPSGTRSVHVQFDFYEIFNWNGDDPIEGPDKFYVYINNQLLDLGVFKLGDRESVQGYNNGIRWRHESVITIPQFLDTHIVDLDIPEKYLTSGTLSLGFQTLISGNANTVAIGGVDDLKIVACSA
jgi:hypothetical protein